MNRFLKLTALILAVIMLACPIASCDKKQEEEQQQQTEEKTEEKTVEEDNTIKVTDTFYPQYENGTEYDSMKEKLKTWAMSQIESASLFSFNTADEKYDAIKARLTKDVKTSADEDGNEIITAVYTDAATSLQVTVDATLYFDNPTLDYVVHLKNTSATDNSVKVTSLYAMNTTFPLKRGDSNYTVHTNKGSAENIDDFLPVSVDLKRTETATIFEQKAGSSSNADVFPFFDVIGGDEGIILAIGWSGNWEAGFNNPESGEVKITARQQTLSASLLPGEEVRTPSIVLTYFEGDYDYGHNVWRRNIISHYVPPTDDEEGFKAPFSLSGWGGQTASDLKEAVDNFKDCDFDIFWLDAGWYGQAGVPDKKGGSVMGSSGEFIWHQYLGVWTQNKMLFPNGIAEVSDYVHDNTDWKVMLWWMIEDARAPKMSQWTFDKEDYYLKKNANGEYDYAQLLKLSDDDVTDRLIAYFSDYIENQHIDCIRLDKSINAGSTWIYNDNIISLADCGEENCRNGITENKYIVNFYRVWDTLYEKYPGFMLDNCSSGGRRIDIEMTKRGIPLWRTDYNSDEDATQAMTQYLSAWLPLTAIGNGGSSSDPYRRRSYYSACTSFGRSWEEDGIANIKAGLAEFLEMRPYWYGDYYQLMDASRDSNSWQAYQLYREDWQKGKLVVIRRNSVISMQKIKLKGLIPEGEYTLHSIDDEGTENDVVKTGSELMEKGISLTQNTRTITVYNITLNLDSVNK